MNWKIFLIFLCLCDSTFASETEPPKRKRPGMDMIELDPFEELERRDQLGESNNDNNEPDESTLNEDEKAIKRLLTNSVKAFNRQDAKLYSSLYVSDIQEEIRIKFGTFFIENNMTVKLWEHFIVNQSDYKAEVMIVYDTLPNRYTIISTVKLEKENGRWLMREERIKSHKISSVSLWAFSPEDHPPVQCSGKGCSVKGAKGPTQQPMGECADGRCNNQKRNNIDGFDVPGLDGMLRIR